MAISQMAKVMIVSHRTEATELLEALQHSGICQILNAEEAMVSKAWPELSPAGQRPRETEELLGRLTKSTAFLKDYAKTTKGLAGIFSPRTVVDEQAYNEAVADEEISGIVEQCEQIEGTIEKLKTECENLNGILAELAPWVSFETPVEEVSQLKTTTCLMGLLANQKFEQIVEGTGELGAAIEIIGEANNKYACLVACLNEKTSEVQKLLRAADFETVNFEPMTGTIADLIKQHNEELNETQKQLQDQHAKATLLAQNLLKLEILCDHYANLLNRDQTKSTAPATEQTVILEGWVKSNNFGRLEKTVSKFGASSLSKVEPAEGEEIPVEIENKNLIKPFEVITRLYGMPQHFDVDPTVFLAPFFALFFGLCLTDAGYGIIMVILSIYFMRKFQGDKKFAGLMIICSVTTIICGGLTGGWFGDAVQVLGIPWLVKARQAVLRFGFDPMEQPKIFFGLALGIGYIQLLSGILVAFFHKLRQRRITEAVCAHLTWFFMLNCFAVYFFSQNQILIPEQYGRFFLYFAIVPATLILLFSHNEGGIVARLGMGTFNLVSVIFYIGDILSYVRLMALGMVTAGLAVAINRFGVMASEVKYVGPLFAALVLIGGHTFNIAMSALGAFVHTLRLQYVEFFPKFFEGGGKLFEPFTKRYKHIYINQGQV
ncbi:MAG: V-type ATP synthase subunit I [Planctomycetota bacterium]|jgi:V/A-type H+-transporting ATPase subunit I